MTKLRMYPSRWLQVIGLSVSLTLFYYFCFYQDFKPSPKPSSYQAGNADKPLFFQQNYYHQTSKFDPTFYLTPKTDIKIENKPNEYRAIKVKESFQHAWKGYKGAAFGHDNLKPISGGKSDDWQGWGITLVDSLGTLLIMNLTKEFDEALEKVKLIDYTKAQSSVMVFETIIRHLGGLISAYDLDPKHSPILLEQAIKLADALLPSFNTPTGLPRHSLNMDTGKSGDFSYYGPNINIIAEVGSLQLEFHRLSQISNDSRYAKIAQKIVDFYDKKETKIKGLYPLLVDTATGELSGRITLGAESDSFYEYLLKRYILTNRTEEQYSRMYQESVDSVHQHMLFQRNDLHDNMVVLNDLDKSGEPTFTMDHLAAFVPGTLALGSVYLNRPQDFILSQELLNTYHFLYTTSPTQLSPDSIIYSLTPYELQTFHNQRQLSKPTFKYPNLFKEEWKMSLKDSKLVPRKDGESYILRPEFVESLFYAFRLTGDSIYREMGWKIYNAIEKNCRTTYGYAEYKDVYKNPKGDLSTYLKDSMESFFLAETLKYLYLLFSPSTLVDLNKYVFTTEAHPLLISNITFK